MPRKCGKRRFHGTGFSWYEEILKIYNNMDKKQMNELADIIIAKLEVKQQQWDEEFHSSINDIHGATSSSKEAFIMTEEEMLIGELARLQTLLMIFENNEEYEKAAILLSKLNHIKTKLRKGDYDGDED